MARKAFVSCFLLVVWLSAAPPAGAQLAPPAQLVPSPPPVTSPVPAPAPVPAVDPTTKLDPLLLRRTSNTTGRSLVIVRGFDAAPLGDVAALTAQMGGNVSRQLPIINAVVADLPTSSLAALAGSALVQRIALNRRAAGTNERTSATVGATGVRQELGYNGTGVGVAVIDSGVTSWHDDLSGSAPGSQRVDQFVDLINGATTPYDDYGHGTHVAGIIAGNGFDSGGARSGIAPGAHLIVLKVLDQNGSGRIGDVIAALDYVVRNKGLFNIRIINLSVAAGVFESYTSDFLTLAAKKAVDAGILVVASAGNVGKDLNGHAQYGGVTAPGNAPWVLTVGASSHMGTIDRSDDTVAAFSSRGPTAVDRAAKPDVVAPGVGIESLSNPNSTMFMSKAPYLLSGTVPTAYPPYLSLSGTSQAAPVVSGTAALMLQANPWLTPNAVKAILQYTAQEYPGYDALTQGAGFLNARGAVDMARFFLNADTSAYPSNPYWSGELIWGNHRVRGGRLSPNANAWQIGVDWGSTTANAQPVAWGTTCVPSDCGAASVTTTWGVACTVIDCGGPLSANVTADNVVWGQTCGGADCVGLVWRSPQTNGGPSGSSDTGETVVWGSTSSGETVVWGSNDSGETVVWGSNDNGETVVWGSSDTGETVVWGSSGGEDVVWRRQCASPGCS